MQAMVIGDLLRHSAGRSPERIALIGQESSLTYKEFDRQADCLANALLGLDLKKGARVAILSFNRPEYAIAYFAIARTPYISVHCSTRSTAAEFGHVLNKTEVDVLLLESCFLSAVAEVLPELGRRPRVIVFDVITKGDAGVADAVHIDAFVRDYPAEPPAFVADESDGFAITLTGGTTGLPKAVLVSHKARCASAIASARDFGLAENDIIIASTPLFHTAGLFVWFGTGVMLGTTTVMPASWDPLEFMRLVEKERVSGAFLVPSQLNDLITHPEFSAASLNSLRNVGYAGAPMGRALFDRIQAALPQVTFTENYGQSEACPITIRRKQHGEAKLGTVGRPASNAEVGIVDAGGRFLAPGEVGDIVTRGAQVFDEYLNDPEETAKVFRLGNGWVLTGDVGFLDEEGFLTLVDRSKDMLISGGENVYPAEIENALYQHEAVSECAVFGIPDERWGEVPAAHVVLAPGRRVSEDELVEFCALKIARFKRPRIIAFVDSLPKTPVGKVQKNLLRDPYWSGQHKCI